MNCCILYRVNGGKLQFVYDPDDENDHAQISEFPDFDAAVAYVEGNKLFQSGQADYQIVELDEL